MIYMQYMSDVYTILKLPKLETRVRLPSAALLNNGYITTYKQSLCSLFLSGIRIDIRIQHCVLGFNNHVVEVLLYRFGIEVSGGPF